MEFFSSTGFYCLAIVVAMALLGVLLHQAPPKPAETYVLRLQLLPGDTAADEQLLLQVMPDGTTLLEHAGIVAPAEAAINLVAERRGEALRSWVFWAKAARRCDLRARSPEGGARWQC